MSLHQAPLSPPLTPSTPSRIKSIQNILACSHLTVDRPENLPCHLLRGCVLRLSDGSRLVTETSPSPSLSLLRCESTYLESEATILELLSASSLPIPRILTYERPTDGTDSPFILESYISGSSLKAIGPELKRNERELLEQQLKSLRSIVSEHRSFAYGPAGLVKAGRGFDTWREAFTAMLESLLMDGEDIMVNIPYFHLREAISRWDRHLDDVTEARLIIPSLCEPEKVMVDCKRNEVTGLLDFGRAFWGDISMTVDRNDGDVKNLL